MNDISDRKLIICRLAQGHSIRENYYRLIVSILTGTLDENVGGFDVPMNVRDGVLVISCTDFAEKLRQLFLCTKDCFDQGLQLVVPKFSHVYILK